MTSDLVSQTVICKTLENLPKDASRVTVIPVENSTECSGAWPRRRWVDFINYILALLCTVIHATYEQFCLYRGNVMYFNVTFMGS